MPIGWRVIEPPTIAALTASTKKASANMSGMQPEMGPIFTGVKPVSAALSGKADPAGSIASSTRRLTAAMNGEQQYVGGMAASTKPAKTNMFGGNVTGTMAPSIKKTLAALAGNQQQFGAMASALKKASAVIAGSHGQSGSLAGVVKKATATATGSAPLVVTNTLSGSTFDTNFWGQNWNSGVYLSSGKVYPNTVGGYFGWGKYYSGITCKTQFSANGAFVSAKASTAAIDDRGTLLCVGIDSPTAMTKVISLAVRPSQGANTVEINKGTGVGLLANANAPATPAANDIWWFGWKKVGSDYVYTGYQNGAVAITWTDTGGATFGVPGRYVGIGSCLIQSNFQNFQDQNGWIGTVTCGDNP